LRSYLGKAYYESAGLWGDTNGLRNKALEQLALAKQLDTNDPTPHLYSALIKRGENRINEAVRDLEKSKDLNENRRLFRSKLLLDQDQAVRSANLTAIYRDAGMTDWSVREATRAVNNDYANYPAHLFLANSFDALRDARQVTLRYETPTITEILLADLLAPIGAGMLSRTVSQQEYSRLFERNSSAGVISVTDYTSAGTWQQIGSQYGTFGGTSYVLDTLYRSQAGRRPNEDLQYFTFEAKFRQHLTPDDSIIFQTIYADSEAGDLTQRYDQDTASRTLRVNEEQAPIVVLGYHHQWGPGSHTLVSAAHLVDTFRNTDSSITGTVYYRPEEGEYLSDWTEFPLRLAHETEMDIWSTELQQIFQYPRGSSILGGRYQFGVFASDSLLTTEVSPVDGILTFPEPLSEQRFTFDFDRVSLYGYQNWKVADGLLLSLGLAYDHIHYPVNLNVPPLTEQTISRARLSPKAGFTWNPHKGTTLRGAYTRSLGGLSFDQSFRLE
ncbi:MAG: TonB-dependent receptor, partial [Nitrososphaera sp.]|nr:TonB-dependent receptor [Nitrososphaera sp.]